MAALWTSSPAAGATAPRGAASPGTDQQPLKRWLAFTRAQRHSPRAAIGLWSLAGLEALADGPSRRALYVLREELSADSKVALAVRRLARAQLAAMDAEAGRADLAQTRQDRQGWLRDWWVIGPFERSAAASATDGPAISQAPFSRQTWPGKRGPVTWRPFPERPADGRIRMHPLFLPRTGIRAWAFNEFALQRPQELLFHLGCDDGCTLRVDGQVIGTEEGPHAHRPDQRTWAVKLPRGRHRVLIEVEQDVSEMAFSLALTDLAGRPPQGLTSIRTDRAAGPPKAAAAELNPPLRIRPRPSLADWFLDRAAAQPDDPQRQAEAAWALFHTAQADRRAHRAEELLAGAIQKGKEGPEGLRWLLWMARLSEDENQSIRWLRRAVDEYPDQPAALARLGLYYQVRGETNRAFSAYSRALAIDGQHLPSRIGLAELHSDLGLFARAESRMNALVTAHPDIPEVLIAAALLFRKHGELHRARAIFEDLLRLRATDQHALRALFELAAGTGDPDRALGYLDRLQAQDPLRTTWWLQRARLLQTHGRGAEALAAVERAGSICPDDAQPYRAKGELLLEQGRDAEAVAALEQALVRAPQDHRLQRRIQALSPSEAPFYTKWQQDAAAWLTRPTGVSATFSAGAERLLDLHVVRLHKNGMASHFRQQLVRILAPRGARNFRTFQVEYAPGRQDVRVLVNRVWHRDGSRNAGVLVNDFSLSEPWYNLYYDVHARQITFPELRPGDVVEVTTLVQDVGDSALLGEYFGDLVAMQYGEPLQSFRYILLDGSNRPLTYDSPVAGATYKVERTGDGTRIHIWAADHLAAVESEPNMPGFTESHGYLHLSTFPAWKKLGAWFYDKIKDQLIGGPAAARLAHKLTAGRESRAEKIRAIYRFVADSTRYVGLEFGIHSYVPYRASQVLQRRYGDCKDKSALLVSLLGEVGIPARLALVRMRRLGHFEAGGSKTGISSPGAPPASLAVFNHAIVYLPEEKLWLDGTAALHGVDDLPSQDQGVQALVIGPEGGQLMETPTNGPERNWTRLVFDIQPRPDGQARLGIRLSVSGTLAPEMRMRFLGGKPAGRIFEGMMEELFAGATVDEVKVAQLADPKLPLRIDGQLALPKLGRPREGGLDLPLLGKTTGYQRMLASEQRRTQDLVIGPGWAVTWQVTIRPPEGFASAPLPKGAEIQSPFGAVVFEAAAQGRVIVSRARFELTAQRVAAADYPAFRRFLGQVDRLLSQHINLSGGKDAL